VENIQRPGARGGDGSRASSDDEGLEDEDAGASAGDGESGSGSDGGDGEAASRLDAPKGLALEATGDGDDLKVGGGGRTLGGALCEVEC
jgi:hypothetical protein